MHKFIICRGIQGSGKSTWAKKWVKEDPNHRIRINQDDIRNMFGYYWLEDKETNNRREKIVREINSTAIKSAMINQFDIVVDNMNLNESTTKSLEDMVKYFNMKYPDKIGYIVEYKNFFIPLEVCIERDSLRERPIGAKVIKATYKRYQKIFAQDFIHNHRKLLDHTLPSAIIVDIDGTLSINDTGRPYYGEGTAKGIIQDACIASTIDLVKLAHNQGWKVFLVTGRSNDEDIVNATKTWLENSQIPYDKIFFRDSGDYSHSQDFKRKVYENNLKDKYCIEFVLEDNINCVKMYRDLGLICLQPNDGNL